MSVVRLWIKSTRRTEPYATRTKDPQRVQGGANVLTIGDKFPEYDLTACVDLDPVKAFAQIDHKSYEGKWRVVFFWPKDFTFVCPTEIAEFGRLNKEFADRDAQVLGGSRRQRVRAPTPGGKQHEDLQEPALPDARPTSSASLVAELGVLDERRRRRSARPSSSTPRGSIQFVMVTAGSRRPQRPGGAARARRAPDRRAVPLQLAQGRGDASTPIALLRKSAWVRMDTPWPSTR